MKPASSRIRLGISRCLLGDHVRYDGGHKRNPYLADVLSRDIDWVPVCPEVEAGLGTPREPMQLVGTVRRPRLLTITTRQDQTIILTEFSDCRIRELKSLNLSGYVFKARSPSCGIEQVPLYDRHGKASPRATGLFTLRFQKEFPSIPVTDEERLADPIFCRQFLERVFGYSRWQILTGGPVTRESIAIFHQREADELQRCSPSHFLKLSHLISQPSRYRPKELSIRYGKVFLEALAAAPSTTKEAHRLNSMHTHHNERARQL